MVFKNYGNSQFLYYGKCDQKIKSLWVLQYLYSPSFAEGFFNLGFDGLGHF